MLKFESRFSLEVEWKVFVLHFGVSRQGTTDPQKIIGFFSALFSKNALCFLAISVKNVPWFSLMFLRFPNSTNSVSNKLPPHMCADTILEPGQLKTTHTNKYSPYLQLLFRAMWGTDDGAVPHSANVWLHSSRLMLCLEQTTGHLR